MKYSNRWSVHLVFDARGVKRMTRGQPDLRGGEYAILLRLKIPNDLFARAFPAATVVVPEATIVKPEVAVVGDSNQITDQAVTS